MDNALTIEGRPIPVRREGAAELAPEVIGSFSRAASGGVRCARFGEKRSWAFATPDLPLAQSHALEVMMADTLIQPCDGYLLGGAVECLVQVVGYTHSRGDGQILRGIRFTLTET